jgi:hypothetical protein
MKLPYFLMTMPIIFLVKNVYPVLFIPPILYSTHAYFFPFLFEIGIFDFFHKCEHFKNLSDIEFREKNKKWAMFHILNTNLKIPFRKFLKFFALSLIMGILMSSILLMFNSRECFGEEGLGLGFLLMS